MNLILGGYKAYCFSHANNYKRKPRIDYRLEKYSDALVASLIELQTKDNKNNASLVELKTKDNKNNACGLTKVLHH